MSDGPIQTDLERKLAACRKDPILRLVFWLVMALNCVSVLFATVVEHLISQHGVWFDCTGLGVLAVASQRFMRHDLRALGFAVWSIIPGIGTALWYDYTGTKRPPSDEYTALALGAGLLIIFATYLVMTARNRRERQRLKALRETTSPTQIVSGVTSAPQSS